MKTLSFITAVFFLMLTVIPCCAVEDCEDLTEPEHQQTENPSTGECGDSCSPFLNCGACAGFVPRTSSHFYTSSPIISKSVLKDYQPGMSTEVIPAVWQPPRNL